jgi:hypothetical protein
MANSFYLHAAKPELVSGLRAVRMYGDVRKDRSDLGVILGRIQEVPVFKGRHREIRKTPDRESNSQVIWTHRKSRPVVRDGKVHDASIVKVKTQRGGTLTLFSAPNGDGKFIVHLETGIPQHWNLDGVAAFMQGVKPDQMRSHGSERIDDGSENVLAHRIRWQRPRTLVPGSADALDPKGVRIYSGDAWLMSPGAQILVHDITGQAFRVVCDKDGPKVTDPGTSKPYETFIGLVKARKDRLAAADAAASDPSSTPPAAAPQPAKSGGWFGR